MVGLALVNFLFQPVLQMAFCVYIEHSSELVHKLLPHTLSILCEHMKQNHPFLKLEVVRPGVDRLNHTQESPHT